MFLINFRLWYKSTPKYLGESVTGSKFRIQKLMTWFMHSHRKQLVGMLVGAQVNWCRLSCCMYSVFPTAKRGKQMIMMTSFSDVMKCYAYA